MMEAQAIDPGKLLAEADERFGEIEGMMSASSTLGWTTAKSRRCWSIAPES